MGASGTILYALREIPKTIYNKIKASLVYSVVVYQDTDNDLFYILDKWIALNSEGVEAQMEAVYVEEPEVSNYPLYPGNNEGQRIEPNRLTYRSEDTTFFLRYKGKKLMVNKKKEKIEKASNVKDLFFRKYTLSGFRAKSHIDLLLKEAIEMARINERKNMVRVHTNNQYGEWEGGNWVRSKPIEKTILNPEVKKHIMDDLNEFTYSEDWYGHSCIPYKRGYCFYGPPGTGKTTLSLAIASKMNKRVYCLNLNSIDDDTRLPKTFSNMTDGSILLIEDIDKVFSGRENVSDDCKVTFSTLLNCLDGAFYKHGLITIITTNHIEKLDEALLRTGRMDVKVEVPKPAATEIGQYMSCFYGKQIEMLGVYDVKMSDVQEMCMHNKHSWQEAKKELEKYLVN